MKSFITFFLLCFYSSFIWSQEDYNLEHISTTKWSDQGIERGNDIWGIKHSNGIEYAIVGALRSTKIYSLENPAQPEHIISFPGADTRWRDIKTHEEFIYVISEDREEGLLIIDFRDVNDIKHKFIGQLFTVPTYSDCHNLYIDQGYAFLANCTGGTIMILNLKNDPWNPDLVYNSGNGPGTEYTHDIFVKNNLMYISRILGNPGYLAILDITDIEDPKEIGTVVTSSGRTHNAWTSDDGQYVFTTDEVFNGFVDSYDVSEPENPRFLDQFQINQTDIFDEGEAKAIPHNTHYHDGFLVTSWYTEGLIIIDAHRPDNLIEVGQFNTFLKDPVDGIDGCWGAYPYLPSGLILTSNISTNSFNDGSFSVFKPNYNRASYLEGVVVDKETQVPLNNVKVKLELIQDTLLERTNADGEFKLGHATNGNFLLSFSHPDYYSENTMINLENGELNFQIIELSKRQEINYKFLFVDSDTGEPVNNVQLKFKNDNRSIDFISDVNGQINPNIIEDDYSIYAGKWEYRFKLLDQNLIQPDSLFLIELESSYEDNFEFDLGWFVLNNNVGGRWRRLIPINSDSPFELTSDIEEDIGEYCYGNESNLRSGTTVLTSPQIDLSQYADPVLSFYHLFSRASGFGFSNDQLMFEIFNDTQNFELCSHSVGGGWRFNAFDLIDLDFDWTQAFRFRAIAADTDTPHSLAIGLDGFKIEERDINSNAITHTWKPKIEIFPNPFDTYFVVHLNAKQSDYLRLYNHLGILVYHSQIQTDQTRIDLDLPVGIYFLGVQGKNGQYINKKIIRY